MRGGQRWPAGKANEGRTSWQGESEAIRVRQGSLGKVGCGREQPSGWAGKDTGAESAVAAWWERRASVSPVVADGSCPGGEGWPSPCLRHWATLVPAAALCVVVVVVSGDCILCGGRWLFYQPAFVSEARAALCLCRGGGHSGYPADGLRAVAGGGRCCCVRGKV